VTLKTSENPLSLNRDRLKGSTGQSFWRCPYSHRMHFIIVQQLIAHDYNDSDPTVSFPSLLFRGNTLQGGPGPLEKEIHEILGSKCEDRFSNHFFELVQKTCPVRFSYLLGHGNLCKGPRTLRKFPQKCQKLGVKSAPSMVPEIWSPRILAGPLRNNPN